MLLALVPHVVGPEQAHSLRAAVPGGLGGIVRGRKGGPGLFHHVRAAAPLAELDAPVGKVVMGAFQRAFLLLQPVVEQLQAQLKGRAVQYFGCAARRDDALAFQLFQHIAANGLAGQLKGGLPPVHHQGQRQEGGFLLGQLTARGLVQPHHERRFPARPGRGVRHFCQKGEAQPAFKHDRFQNVFRRVQQGVVVQHGASLGFSGQCTEAPTRRQAARRHMVDDFTGGKGAFRPLAGRGPLC